MEEIIKSMAPFTTQIISAGALLLASFTSLFSVVNPLTAMPVYLSLTAGDTKHDMRQTANKAVVYMFFVLTTFLLAGPFILSFFGISLSGIRIAGGLIIAQAGFGMLNPNKRGGKISQEEHEQAKEKSDISFSPLAMPLLSGPGSIAVVIGFGSQATNAFDYVINGLAITLTVLSAYGILRMSPWLNTLIGKTGMNVITRMMGFIALSIGVQFIINGISTFFGVGG